MKAHTGCVWVWWFKNRLLSLILTISSLTSTAEVASAALLQPECQAPTCVNEPAWCSFAELFGFVGQCHLHHAGDVPRGRLDADGVRRDQLGMATGQAPSALGSALAVC
uniref:Secreted protein n=1 Tax=Catharus ustulatus TaxID=91951 RepID=A0A8C3UCJ2_CATUS